MLFVETHTYTETDCSTRNTEVVDNDGKRTADMEAL